MRPGMVLIGCAAAVAVIAWTDGQDLEQAWACNTDAECEQESQAHERGELCLRLPRAGTLACYQPDRD